VSHLGDRELSVLVNLLLDSLLVETTGEGLGDGVVPATAFPAHTWFEMIRTTEAAPGVAAERGALVRVNQRPSWPPSTNGHQHGIEDELAVYRRLSRRYRIARQGSFTPPAESRLTSMRVATRR